MQLLLNGHCAQNHHLGEALRGGASSQRSHGPGERTLLPADESLEGFLCDPRHWEGRKETRGCLRCAAESWLGWQEHHPGGFTSKGLLSWGGLKNRGYSHASRALPSPCSANP